MNLAVYIRIIAIAARPERPEQEIKHMGTVKGGAATLRGDQLGQPR
jgi:hypothetical protein